MRIKILYVDPISAKGHIGFNKIYVNALLENKQYDVDFVFRENYCKSLDIEKSSLDIEIPKSFYKNNRGGLRNRIYFYKILVFIKKTIDFSKYDYVLFGNYEEISFFLSGISKRCFLVNHHNLQGLENPIKKMFFKLVSNRNVQVVFEKSFKRYLNSIEINNVEVSPHGLPMPFELEESVIKDSVYNFMEKKNLKFKSLIFIPSSSSVDKKFVNNLLKSELFINFLEKNKILLLIKGDFEMVMHSLNVVVSKEYFSKTLYQSLFLKSDIVLIPYPSTFRNRVSGVFFECISNNKLCLLSKDSELINYKDAINYNPYFQDLSDLIERIKENIVVTKNRQANKFNSLEYFRVDLKFINKVIG